MLDAYDLVRLAGTGLVGAEPLGAIVSVRVVAWSAIVCGTIVAAVLSAREYPEVNVAMLPAIPGTRKSSVFVNGHRIVSSLARTAISSGSLVVPPAERLGHLRKLSLVSTSATSNACPSGPASVNVTAVCLSVPVGTYAGGCILNVSSVPVSVAPVIPYAVPRPPGKPRVALVSVVPVGTATLADIAASMPAMHSESPGNG